MVSVYFGTFILEHVGEIILTLVTLGCLTASNCQPGHHGLSAISNNLHGPGCCQIPAGMEYREL